jgi:Flp pilus assembly protein TadD
LNNLAWLYDQKGNREKALGYARRAYELSPKQPEIADPLLGATLKAP